MSGEINDTVIIFSFVRSQAEKKSRFWTFFLITQEFSYNLLHNCVLIGCDLFFVSLFSGKNLLVFTQDSGKQIDRFTN